MTTNRCRFILSIGDLNNFWPMINAMNVAYAVQLHVLKISEYFSSIAKQRGGSICKEKYSKRNSSYSSALRHTHSNKEGIYFGVPLQICLNKRTRHLS